MTTLKDFLEAVNFKITGGSEYGWDCFGPNARYLDCSDSDSNDGTYSINAVFDSKTQEIYQLEMWDYVNHREYRWIDSFYRPDFEAECGEKGINTNESLDGNKFIDVEVPEDIFEKINSMVLGKEYDTRIKVPVDFSDEDLLKYMKLAHEMDITFNELVERAIKAAIDDYNSNPEEYKQRAQRFFDED